MAVNSTLTQILMILFEQQATDRVTASVNYQPLAKKENPKKNPKKFPRLNHGTFSDSLFLPLITNYHSNFPI